MESEQIREDRIERVGDRDCVFSCDGGSLLRRNALVRFVSSKHESCSFCHSAATLPKGDLVGGLAAFLASNQAGYLTG